jgi:hypothetical protein
MATAANPPLYLHITSTSKEGLEKAVSKIEELMQQELPNLVDERRFRRREDNIERDDRGRPKWKEEKIPINLEPLPGFNLRAQVVGHGGQYVKHIQQETACRVQIKGRGSGFIEHATNMEADEDMFLHVTGPDPAMVEKGKELCEDLVANVREQYEDFKRRPPPSQRFGGYGDRRDRDREDRYRDRDRHDGHHHGHGNHHGRNGSYGQQGGHHGNGGGDYGAQQQAVASPATPTVTSETNAAVSQADYAAQYAQYYGGQDPYAAYGGYAAYYQMYQNYLASQGGQAAVQGQQPQGAAPGTLASPPPPPSDAAPPPPPPSSAAPPPPPGPPGASGSYSAVPPPPGL